jgi:segregation and condensation protein A
MVHGDAPAETADGPEPGWNDLDAEAPRAGEQLVVDIEGFEGPLDLLLALARTQKVDIRKISVLALAEQYLAFIREATALRIEIAADYLVMAAWLAFLKSRLLLPKEKDDTVQPSGEELALRLQFRLMRLEAMRKAAAQLMTRKRLDIDVFQRGNPEGIRTIRERQYTAEIYDLLKAYAEQRSRTAVKRAHVVKRRPVWSIKEARTHLQRLVGASDGQWVQLDMFLEQYLPAPEMGRTALASSFGATLEMARDGLVEIRQDQPFAPIFMRRREDGADWVKVG